MTQITRNWFSYGGDEARGWEQSNGPAVQAYGDATSLADELIYNEAGNEVVFVKYL